MGHATTATLERVYGRLGDVRQRRPHVESRWEEWEPTMGHRLLGVELVGLTPAQRGTLVPAPSRAARWRQHTAQAPITAPRYRERQRSMYFVQTVAYPNRRSKDTRNTLLTVVL